MAMEGPVCVSMLSRRFDPELQTAAFTAIMAMALWIESPVIDLLATSTTLSKDRNSFLSLRKFALAIMATATSIHALFVLTPLYGWATASVLSYPKPLADAAHAGMVVMIPWSACIGWRRFLQGILIRHGYTKRIGFGTGIRVGTLASVAIGLAALTKIPGATIAGCALIASVAAEVVFVHFAAWPIVREKFLGSDVEAGEPLPIRRLWKFHLPLTATTLVTLSGPLLASRALALSPSPVLGLAGYQVAAALIWLHRTAVYALPEAVITLIPEDLQRRTLSRFCSIVGFVTTGSMAALALTGLDRVVFGSVFKATAEEMPFARLAFVGCILMPLLGAWQSYARGVLTYKHITVARLYAIGVGVTAMVLLLELGIHQRWTGVVTVAAAGTVSMALELGVLGWFVNRKANARDERSGEPLLHETADQAAEMA